MTQAEKSQLTKEIKYMLSYIHDMDNEIKNQYPQPDGAIYLYGEQITIRRYNGAIKELDDLMLQRHGIKSQIEQVTLLKTRKRIL